LTDIESRRYHTVVHGYHAIFVAYGFWLPNDPRGSWSDFVGAWELRRFGPATKSLERKDKLSPADEQLLLDARSVLRYPAVHFNGIQARAIGRGFARSVEASGFTIWACSILPEHVHLVLGRQRFKVEQTVRLLKGAATKQLNVEDLHPLKGYVTSRGDTPTPWADRKWKVYLDSEEAIENAIRYVEENPLKEGLSRQPWPFVRRFSGLDTGGWTTYH
jgi:REP element-mobilizing transposase RayT